MRTSLIVVAAAAALAGGTYALQADEPALTGTGPRVKATLAAEWPTAAPARAPAFSRDGKLLALSDATGAIVIRDTSSWKAVRRLTHPGGATSVLFTKGGGSLISAGYDGSIRFWDLATGKQTGIINGSAKAIWTLDLSPDGSRLAAAGEDNIIRIWDLRAPLNPLELRGHGRNVWEVRFSPDGKRLASGSFDRSVRLWDATTGAQLKVLNGHKQAVVGLDYSPDGKLLASGGDDSTIRYWRAPTARP